ncbi:MAG TPA: hypothetical protein VLD64_02280 [Nitrosarchaeum sp.]|nr:hypothetical protein [Nitrosarchaeum sp.]
MEALDGIQSKEFGMAISAIGGIIFVVGLLAGLTRGFNRMMRE